MKILKNKENVLDATDDIMAFRHDFNNIIFTIGGFIDSNDMNGLKQYYKELEKDCQRINTISLLNPKLINNPGVYSLLSAKYQKAINLNINFQLEFFFDLNKLCMSTYDFTRILGILLDNAIEAANLSNEKLVKIMFRDSVNSHTQIIEIKNSYNNKNIDTHKIFEKGITEKGNHSGIGLWVVKKIIRKYNNVNLITNAKKDFFQQTLQIYY